MMSEGWLFPVDTTERKIEEIEEFEKLWNNGVLKSNTRLSVLMEEMKDSRKLRWRSGRCRW